MKQSFLEICRAISELHRIEISHCDLSTENIMIDAQRYKGILIDFDLSHKFGENSPASVN